MAYSEQQNKRNIEYVKEHQKQIQVKYKKEEYEDFVKPAIEKSGMPVATFIKMAVKEKIERDNLL